MSLSRFMTAKLGGFSAFPSFSPSDFFLRRPSGLFGGCRVAGFFVRKGGVHGSTVLSNTRTLCNGLQLRLGSHAD
jgi:hypothetical protein